MSGTLRVYSSVHVEANGEVSSGGRLDVPIAEVTCEGSPRVMEQEYTLSVATDADDPTTWDRQVLYDHSYDGLPTFKYMEFVVIGEGGVWLYVLSDQATDEATDDLDPTNTSNTIRWSAGQWCDNTGLKVPALTRQNPTAATHIGGTAGYPTAATSLTTVNSRNYKVVAYLPSADDTVRILRRIVF